MAITGVLRIAGLDCQRKRIGDDAQAGLVGSTPEIDEAAKHQLHLGADVRRIEPVTQGHRQTAKLLGAACVSELGANHHAINYVAEG